VHIHAAQRLTHRAVRDGGAHKRAPRFHRPGVKNSCTTCRMAAMHGSVLLYELVAAKLAYAWSSGEVRPIDRRIGWAFVRSE